jgi:hypothetical protein
MSWVPIVMIVGIAVVNLVLRVMANKGSSGAAPGPSARGNLEALKVLAEELARDPQAGQRATSPSSASVGGTAAPRRVVRAGAPMPIPAPASTARPPKPPPALESVTDRVTPRPIASAAKAVSPPAGARVAVVPKPVERKPKDRRWLRQAMVSSILLGPPKSLES